MNPIYTIGACTDRGKRKNVNEDAFGYLPPEKGLRHPKGLLIALADGMGGRAGGDQASRIAVDRVLEVFYQDGSNNIPASLERAFHAANRSVIETGNKDTRVQGMATTLTAAVLLDSRLYHAHVGDSRAYVVEAKGIRCLTKDHTFVASLVRAGAITSDQARTHPQRNLLTQAIGASEEIRIDLSLKPYRLENRSSILLCCDGLYKDLTDIEILEVIRKSSDAQSACETLIDMANDRGGTDNITAVLVQVGGIGGFGNAVRRIFPAR